VELEQYKHGGARKNQDAPGHLETRAELAKSLDVSPRSVARAKKVKQSGTLEDVQAVKNGKLSVRAAEKKIKSAAEAKTPKAGKVQEKAVDETGVPVPPVAKPDTEPPVITEPATAHSTPEASPVLAPDTPSETGALVASIAKLDAQSKLIISAIVSALEHPIHTRARLGGFENTVEMMHDEGITEDKRQQFREMLKTIISKREA
jgi:hypothetical protein